jgi:FkbM family methyltransferase
MQVKDARSPLKARPGLLDRLYRAYLRRGWRGFISLWKLSGRDFRSTLRAETSKGPIFELSPFAYIDAIVLREGYYESEVIEAIAPILGEGVLWDVGANFGLHALTAKHLVPGSRVICFEPSFEMLTRLAKNRELNRLEVEIVGLALSDRSGFQTFYMGQSGNPGMSTLSPWSAATYSGTCLVATARGDDLISQKFVPPPTVIKLDVEGHEMRALEGLADTLRLPSLLAIVYEDTSEPDSNVKSVLRAAGFSSERLNRLGRSQHLLENFIARR